jgi:hypothetical protein
VLIATTTDSRVEISSDMQRDGQSLPITPQNDRASTMGSKVVSVQRECPQRSSAFMRVAPLPLPKLITSPLSHFPHHRSGMINGRPIASHLHHSPLRYFHCALIFPSFSSKTQKPQERSATPFSTHGTNAVSFVFPIVPHGVRSACPLRGGYRRRRYSDR